MAHVVVAANFAFLLLLALVPAVASQAPVGVPGRVLIADPAGDVRSGPPGFPNITVPPDVLDYVDLKAVWMGTETKEGLELGVQFGRVTPPAPAVFGRTAEVDFQLGENFYQVKYHIVPQLIDSICLTVAKTPSPTAERANVRCLQPQNDFSSNTIRVFLPSAILVNETGVPFQPGMSIYGLRANARALAWAGTYGFIVGNDQAPDIGSGPPYTSSGTDVALGSALLTAIDRIRVSNGESTTMVFPVLLSNLGEEPVTYVLSIQHMDPSFSGRVPARLVVPSHGVERFPVIVSMNFTHRHGETSYFDIVAESSADPNSRARIQLGVYWLETPQPAGHHNTLWFHTGPSPQPSQFDVLVPGQRVWTNPMEKDPDPTAKDDNARPTFVTANPPTASWDFKLFPELRIGLDFDLDQKGLFEAKIRHDLPATQARLNVTIIHCDPSGHHGGTPNSACGPNGRNVPMATGESAPRAATTGENSYLVEIKPLPYGDYVPYQAGAGLGVRIALKTDLPQNDPLAARARTEIVTQSAQLQLPLIEYHDAVDQAFANVGHLELSPLGPFERFGNPGRTVTFRFNLANGFNHEVDLYLSTEGINADWARFVGGDRVTLDAVGIMEVVLAVAIPDDAMPGQRAELFVVAEVANEPSVVAISRLRASVVDPAIEEVPEETAFAESMDGSAVATLTGPLVIVALSVGLYAAARRSAW